MLHYHDEEWGVPVHDDRRLFEFMVLEGAQAGLTWMTVLRRREAYRAAFAAFDPIRIARFDRRKVESLMRNDAIIRNRRKIEGAIQNARAYLSLRENGKTLSDFMWDFVGGEPIVNPVTKQEHRARSDLPNGFEFTLAEAGRGWANTAGAIKLNLADSHAHFAKLHITGTGVVH